MRPGPFDALVLAGGAARRLGGADKPGLRVGGRTLLEAVLDACSGAAQVVVVGPHRDLPAGVAQVREDPPGGGPVPALLAGLPLLRAPWVALLAADLPFLDVPTLDRLRGAAAGGTGALLVDGSGREQWLCGVWPVAALRAARFDTPRLRDVLGDLGPVRVATAAGARAPWQDCDTAEDLARARRAAEGDAGHTPASRDGDGRR